MKIYLASSLESPYCQTVFEHLHKNGFVVNASDFDANFSNLKSSDVVVALDIHNDWTAPLEVGYAISSGIKVIACPFSDSGVAFTLLDYISSVVDCVAYDLPQLMEALGYYEKQNNHKNKTVIKFKKLHKDAKAPFRAHPEDRGADLTCVTANFVDGCWKYGSGLAFEFPDGLDAEVRSRSSIHKTGLILSNGVGTIDNGYRGEVKGVFYPIIDSRYGFDPYKVGDRFAQMIIPGVDPRDIVFKEVNQLSETVRGAGGYGSTGK